MLPQLPIVGNRSASTEAITLSNAPGGYRLDSGNPSDVAQFEKLAAAGHRARELGLEPSVHLQRLQRTMLSADRESPELLASWHDATAEGRHRVVAGDFVRGR